ncbi:MAG: MinD/ParA family protein, partial [Planctomycetota bacterium]|nr:MinD/ParA family protein [Planctomycetota bacterium]
VAAHLGHVLDGVRSLDDILIDAPGGFRLAPGGGGVARLASLRLEEQERLAARLQPLESDADYLLIDCGAGLGPQVLSFIRFANAALIVTTPEPTAIADAYALIKAAAHGASSAAQFRPSLIVNQCDGEAEALRVHRRIAAVCARFLDLDLPLMGWTPDDPMVRDAVRVRNPFVIEHPRCRAARRVRILADALIERFEPAPRNGRRHPRVLSRLIRLGR